MCQRLCPYKMIYILCLHYIWKPSYELYRQEWDIWWEKKKNCKEPNRYWMCSVKTIQTSKNATTTTTTKIQCKEDRKIDKSISQRWTIYELLNEICININFTSIYSGNFRNMTTTITTTKTSINKSQFHN